MHCSLAKSYLCKLTLVLTLATGTARAAETTQLDSNPTLFAVMCALHAAGFDTEISSTANHPLRKAVFEQLTAKNPKTAAEIRDWLQNRKLDPKNVDLDRFVSFALAVDGPPNFNYRFQTHEMPPDVIPLEGFEKLLSRFYAEAGVEEMYTAAQPQIETALGQYQEPIVQTLNGVNAYLRNPTSGYMGRRFFVYLELLAPPNRIQTRAYRDDFYLILSPSSEQQLDYVRYAYLQYLLDPLSFKFTANLEKKKPLIDLAQAAPALGEHYKSDFSLLATASLIKAIETRMDRNRSIEEALREGFILAPYFAEALAKYEAQEVSMRLYYPEMIDAIDLKKEDKRLAGVQFDPPKQGRLVRVTTKEEKIESIGVFKTLEEAEDLYRARKIEPARAAWLRGLQETAEKPLHAKCYYGLARLAALEKNPELADKLFRKVLELEPDAQTKAWSHVYLGRLSDLANDREQAQQQYQAALNTTDASEAARKAAQQGLSQQFQTPKEK